MEKKCLVRGTLLNLKLSYIKLSFGEQSYKKIDSLLREKYALEKIIMYQWYEEVLSEEINQFFKKLALVNKDLQLKKLGSYLANNTLSKLSSVVAGGFKVEQRAKMALTHFNALWGYGIPSVSLITSSLLEIVFPNRQLIKEEPWIIAGFIEESLALSGVEHPKATLEEKHINSNLLFNVSFSDTYAPDESVVIISIENEGQIVEARQRVKNFAQKMGFGVIDTTRIVTCVSELARNIVYYAGKGNILIEEGKNSRARYLRLKSEDKGPGIKNLDEIMNGYYKSEKGLGMGLRVVKKLSDEMNIYTSEGRGTEIDLVYYLQ